METGFRLWLLTLPRLLGFTHDLSTQRWPRIRDREKQRWPEKAGKPQPELQTRC